MHESEHEPAIDDRCPSDTELESKILKDIEAKKGNTRQILWLYFVMGHKNEEIHRILGGSYRSIYSAVDDFKIRCRNEYGYLMRD
jgi:hypothetical protein